jgi:uncharacterized protein with PQ loop repeat
MIGAIAAVFAGVPQLRKLLQSKQADEFSVPTWTIWLFSQVAALMYALSIHDLLYTLVSAFWTVFYAFMVVLIFKYRNNTISFRKLALKKLRWSRVSS